MPLQHTFSRAQEKTILEMLQPGAHIIAMEAIYGGTFRLFEKVKKNSTNLETSFINFNDEKELNASTKSNTNQINNILPEMRL